MAKGASAYPSVRFTFIGHTLAGDPLDRSHKKEYNVSDELAF